MIEQINLQNLRHLEYFSNNGMGTENVGPLLHSLCKMIRPNRILEIGLGYTTPFLLEAIEENRYILFDGNLKDDYVNQEYDPKIVCIDDLSLIDEKYPLENLKNSNFIDIICSQFQGKSKFLKNKYGNFDFVWFDCGGIVEYNQFIEEYWDICSKYILFHYTFHNGKPTELFDLINRIDDDYEIINIIEPHKYRQGNITIIRKNKKINYDYY